MGFGAIIPAALGSVTAPVTVILATPSAQTGGTSVFPAWGKIDAVQIPSVAAVAFFHGAVGQRYSLEGNSLTLGLLAPDSGMTATDHGSGSGPAIGDYQYGMAEYRSIDGAQSGVSVVSTSILTRTVQSGLLAYTQTVAHQVDLAAFPTLNADDAADYHRWFRTATGGDLLFKGTDTTSSSANDTLTDANISGPGAFSYDEKKYRLREQGWPIVGRHGILWRGRLWSAGKRKAADYSAGLAFFTNGSSVVTGSAAARWKKDMVGRTIQRTANSLEEFLVVAVDEATPSVTLSRNWTDSTNVLGAVYRIRDNVDPFELFFTEPQLWSNSPVQNSIKAVTSRDPSGVTALAVLMDRLIVFTKTNVWTVSGDVGSFETHLVGEGYGAFNGDSVVSTPFGLYWIGPDGCFAWGDPNGLPTNISKPEGDAQAGIQGTIDAIDGDEADGIVSNYNPSSLKVRWWIPLDGSPTNRDCLRLDLQSKTFALHSAADVTAAVTIPGPGGRAVTIVGDVQGDLKQVDAGWIDGCFGFEPVQAVSSYSSATRTLTVVGTPLPTSGNGLKGATVVLLPAAGPPYEIAVIASNTSSAVVFTAPLDASPAISDILIFGGIPIDLETPFTDWEEPELYKWCEGATVAHEVETKATEMWCGVAADSGDAKVLVAYGASTPDASLMTDDDGEHHFWLSSFRGRSLKLRFLAFQRGFRVRLRGYVASIRSAMLAEVEG